MCFCLQARGLQTCAMQIESGSAWETRDGCCAVAWGDKGCRVYKDECWVRGSYTPDRTCILVSTLELILQAVCRPPYSTVECASK